MLLAVFLSTFLLALPPADLPLPAYPTTALVAQLPLRQTPDQVCANDLDMVYRCRLVTVEPWNAAWVECEWKPTADDAAYAFYSTCQDTLTRRSVMLCSWQFLGTPPGVLADWQTSCSQFGGNGRNPFFCRVTVHIAAPTYYDCRKYHAGGRWNGWVE